MRMGYDGVQVGTRFIATPECRASEDYKQAIVAARAEDIVLSERITGVPVAVIDTPFVRRVGLEAGPLARWMLRGRRRKKWMRSVYALRSLWRLRSSSLAPVGTAEVWQAGRSVEGIREILPVADIMAGFRESADRVAGSRPR
jgi:nitronate monooxygenase